MKKALLLMTLILSLSPDISARPAQTLDNLVLQSQQKQLWKKQQWLDLVHYRPRWIGGYKSEADAPEFFLAGKKGKKNPELELIATLKGFAKIPAGETESHPQCRFPARYRWLHSELGWGVKIFPRVECERYEAFRKKVDAKSVSLIFSSYYLNNPSSAYGHTFLRLNKAPSVFSGKRHELLDQGINYAAVMTTQNTLLYAFMGLTGMFRGTFTSMPYFYKVREYNDFESRDLWEYNLNLSSQEVHMLVDHLWEQGSNYFDYFYITEYCSYHMITTLDAAVPQYHLTDRLSDYIIPSDTVKTVYETPGFVSSVEYRPSVRAHFRSRLNQLSKKDQGLMWEVVSRRDLKSIESLEGARKAAILDTAIDYVDLKSGKKILKNDPDLMGWKQTLLVARSQVKEITPPLEIPTPAFEAPHRGHGTARTGVSGGYSDQLGAYTRFSHRFAFHDFLDSQAGYPAYMEMDFVKADIRYNFRTEEVWLENASLINIFSLADFSRFDKSMTWKLQAGATTFRDNACFNCLGGILEGGVGLSRKFSPLWVTAMIDGEVSGSPDFTGSPARLRFGPMIQVRLAVSPHLQMLLRSQYRQSVVDDFKANMESSLGWRWEFAKNWAMDVHAKQFLHPQILEGGGGIYFYY